jgi:hypothetical protein
MCVSQSQPPSQKNTGFQGSSCVQSSEGGIMDARSNMQVRYLVGQPLPFYADIEERSLRRSPNQCVNSYNL